MPARIDRTNRVLLALFGLLLLGSGLWGLARSIGWPGQEPASEPVLPAPGPAVDDAWWFWLVVATVALLVALLALWWLTAQASRDRVSQLEVDPTRTGGETWLRSASIADGVQQEVDAFTGVHHSKMSMLGSPGRHRHRLVVFLTDRADIESVRSQLTIRTIPNIRRALDFEDPQLDVELVLARRQRRQVR